MQYQSPCTGGPTIINGAEVDVCLGWVDSYRRTDLLERFFRLDQASQAEVINAKFVPPREFIRILELAESPIERILGIALVEEFGRAGCIMTVLPQCPFRLPGGEEYRVDFLLVDWGTQFKSARCSMVVVECDGHDFHDRTRFQASSDRRRDRGFTACGIPVVRFTGADINKNPGKCAADVMEIYRSVCQRSEAV